jgi:hypothetical protein
MAVWRLWLNGTGCAGAGGATNGAARGGSWALTAIAVINPRSDAATQTRARRVTDAQA